ncbi:hypothetical protein WDB89_04970 [Pseudoalteromonas sp. B5MOD-1]|uniref:hypothetical protein n=1 Tax=Pseudoalteromonas TaxID=53246 RepID=UPI000AC895BF|nr:MULTISPECIES: hypothetical protein [Pseudoalteromonas]MCO7207985.1 hypothetical protein [Pseudoalteromonas sp. CnMc7-37]
MDILSSALSSIDDIKFVIEGVGIKWPVDVTSDLVGNPASKIVDSKLNKKKQL